MDIEIPDGATAAVVVFLGDTDDDGVFGVKGQMLIDVPFDGTDELVSIFDTPEFEPVEASDAGELVDAVFEFVQPIVEFFAKTAGLR